MKTNKKDDFLMQGHDAAGVRNQQKKRRYEGRTEELSYQGQFLLFFSLSLFLSISIYLSSIYICFPLFLPLSLSIFLTILSTITLEKGRNC